MTNITISLDQFQVLIYIFPTILFFISLTARLILKYSTNKNSLESIFQFAGDIVNEIKNESTNIKDIKLGSLMNQLFSNIDSKQIGQKIIKNNAVTIEDKKQRNSHFLFGFYIDSFALSIVNGVIIMFQTLNLFYGFILLFLGMVMGLFGFALIFTNRLSMATFLSTIIVFILFIPELLFLSTSSLSWFEIVPLAYIIIMFVVVIISLIYARKNKKKTENKAVWICVNGKHLCKSNSVSLPNECPNKIECNLGWGKNLGRWHRFVRLYFQTKYQYADKERSKLMEIKRSTIHGTLKTLSKKPTPENEDVYLYNSPPWFWCPKRISLLDS